MNFHEEKKKKPASGLAILHKEKAEFFLLFQNTWNLNVLRNSKIKPCTLSQYALTTNFYIGNSELVTKDCNSIGGFFFFFNVLTWKHENILLNPWVLILYKYLLKLCICTCIFILDFIFFKASIISFELFRI